MKVPEEIKIQKKIETIVLGTLLYICSYKVSAIPSSICNTVARRLKELDAISNLVVDKRVESFAAQYLIKHFPEAFYQNQLDSPKVDPTKIYLYRVFDEKYIDKDGFVGGNPSSPTLIYDFYGSRKKIVAKNLTDPGLTVSSSDHDGYASPNYVQARFTLAQFLAAGGLPYVDVGGQTPNAFFVTLPEGKTVYAEIIKRYSIEYFWNYSGEKLLSEFGWDVPKVIKYVKDRDAEGIMSEREGRKFMKKWLRNYKGNE